MNMSVLLKAPFHCGPDLCIPNGGQAVLDPGVPARRRALHAARERGDLYGGHSLVRALPSALLDV